MSEFEEFQSILWIVMTRVATLRLSVSFPHPRSSFASLLPLSSKSALLLHIVAFTADVPQIHAQPAGPHVRLFQFPKVCSRIKAQPLLLTSVKKLSIALLTLIPGDLLCGTRASRQSNSCVVSGIPNKKPERRGAADPEVSGHHLPPEGAQDGRRSLGVGVSCSSKCSLLFPGLLIQQSPLKLNFGGFSSRSPLRVLRVLAACHFFLRGLRGPVSLSSRLNDSTTHRSNFADAHSASLPLRPVDDKTEAPPPPPHPAPPLPPPPPAGAPLCL